MLDGNIGDDEDLLDIIRGETAPGTLNRNSPSYVKLQTEPPALRTIFGFVAGWLLAKFTDTQATDPLPDEQPDNILSLEQWRHGSPEH